MTEWISLVLDVILIGFVGVGVVQATRLITQLRDLRAGRAEMERFVREFNSAILRAEAGIKSLRATARESGDDLEKLVGKAVMVRDELNFIVESADGVAERLSVSASSVLHVERSAQTKTQSQETPKASSPAAASEPKTTSKQAPAPQSPSAEPPSRAEKELLQALKKMS